MQGSAPTLQGSAPKLQSTYNPQTVATFTQPQLGTVSLGQNKVQGAATSGASSVGQAQSDYNNLLKQIRDLQSSLNQKAYAPSLDVAAINAKARAAAEGAVNPYYIKQLNDFLTQQAAVKRQQEQQTATNIQNLEETLSNTLQEHTVKQQRTGEDVAKNLATISTEADQFQTDSGQQYDAERIAQAKQLAQAGLTGGIGAQQQESAQTAHNTQEKRQEQQFQTGREGQELFKARTFEDLSRAGELAKGSTEKGKKQAQVDLANFIENQGFETESKKSQIETARLQAVGQEISNQGRLLVNNFISSIANPAQRQAALQAYGGLY